MAGQPPGRGVEAARSDDAVAGGVLDQVQLGVARNGGPIGLAAVRVGDVLHVTEAGVIVIDLKARRIGDTGKPAVGVASGLAAAALAYENSRFKSEYKAVPVFSPPISTKSFLLIIFFSWVAASGRIMLR
jgi:hypothetical protein